MQVDILTAIIALGGVFLSALISYGISLRQTKIELDKHSEQIRQEFSRRLFEKRMSVYPELYSFLSDFIKKVHFGDPNRDDVEQLFSQIQSWDSKNAILFSAKAGRVAYYLRTKLFELLKKSEPEMIDFLVNQNNQKQLILDIQAVELSLKSELGVYAIESPTEIGEFTYYENYGQVSNSIK